MTTTLNFDREDLQALLAKVAENKVRTLAHELYEAQGKADGHTVEDWLKSETEAWEPAKH